MNEKPRAKKVPLGPVGERFRENIRRAREVRGVTYVELSERLGKLGRPIPPLGLSRLESGERRVDVDDLVAIVRALNLPSVADELMPQNYGDSDPVQVTSALETTAQEAWRLFSGERRPTNPFDGLDADEFVQIVALLRPVGEAARAAVEAGATVDQVAAVARAEAFQQLRERKAPRDLRWAAQTLRDSVKDLEGTLSGGLTRDEVEKTARRMLDMAEEIEDSAAAFDGPSDPLARAKAAQSLREMAGELDESPIREIVEKVGRRGDHY